MDDGARHADGAVEDQAPFNLNAAIRMWRDELSSRPGFRVEDLEELESHLREGVEDLQQRALSDAEAFLIASRRLGTPSALQAEYSRINRYVVWLDRLVWMLLGYGCVAGMFSLPFLLIMTVAPPIALAARVPQGLLLAGLVMPLSLAAWIIRAIVRDARSVNHPWGLALMGFAAAAAPRLMNSMVQSYLSFGRLDQQWMRAGITSMISPVFVGAMILVAARYRQRLIRE